MSTPKEPTVDTPSSAYQRMRPRWALIDALLGGTETMRAAGQNLLPQHEKESNKNYQNRLDRNVLLNMYEDTVETLSGKPFQDPVVVNDDVPAEVAGLLEDVDLQGTALQPLCRSWFREGWAKGFAHVLVDQSSGRTRVNPDGSPRPRTLADDREEGIRPFWAQIHPENVIAAFEEVVDGRRRLSHVRILESSIEKDGFGERCVERIRVLEPGRWETWLYDPREKKYKFEDRGETGLSVIPLVTFYTAEKTGLMECKPPLTDLAHLNIAHWQSNSDQRNVLTVARFPILAASGAEIEEPDERGEGGGVKIGPNNYLTTTENGKWYYVEHTGAAIEAGRMDLQDLENQMASYGSEFLRRRPGTETATARAIDSSDSSSYLKATVEAFQDCVAQALQLTADWMRAGEGGTICIPFEDEPVVGNEQPELDTLNKARDRRDLSRVGYLAELKSRGVLSEDFDADADQEHLDDEAPSDGLSGMFDQPAVAPTPAPAPAPTPTPGGGE